MLIRSFIDADRPALAELQLASWRTAYKGQVPEAELGDALTDTITKRWQSLTFAKDEFALVAEGDTDQLAGFVTVFAKGMPYIDNFHVHPNAYRSGIGRQLMRAAASKLLAQGESSVHLTMLVSNKRAAGFYNALGGEITKQFDYPFLGEPKPVLQFEWHDLEQLSQA